MKDLYQMGITAGSMFPGLDGACEALKEQYFPLAVGSLTTSSNEIFYPSL
jgi:hypothetical protein